MTEKLSDEAVVKLCAKFMECSAMCGAGGKPWFLHQMNGFGIRLILSKLDDIALVEQKLIEDGHGERLQKNLVFVAGGFLNLAEGELVPRDADRLLISTTFATARQRAGACARTIREIGGATEHGSQAAERRAIGEE